MKQISTLHTCIGFRELDVKTWHMKIVEDTSLVVIINREWAWVCNCVDNFITETSSLKNNQLSFITGAITQSLSLSGLLYPSFHFFIQNNFQKGTGK